MAHRWAFIALVMGLLSGGVSSVVAEGPIKDPQLELVVKAILKVKQIDKPVIDEADLKSLFILDARNQGIKDLTGLEKCPNLVEVKLSGNEIESLAPLAELKNIQSLSLSSNKIKDITPLAGLVKLQHLELEKNQIAVLTGLEKLDNMRSLNHLPPEAAKGEAALIERLSPTTQAARAWADLAQTLGNRARRGRAVNLDPAALLMDMVLKIDEVAGSLAQR